MSNAIDIYDTSACFDTEKPAKKPKPHRVWRPVDVPQPVCACGLDIDLEQIITVAVCDEGLTPKENLILLYVFKCLSTKEMSDALSNTEKTLKHHIAMVFNKLRVHSRPELIATLFNLNDARLYAPTCSCGTPIDFVGYIIFAAWGAGLTPKETTVLLYLCRGLATKEIANMLGNTERHSSITSLGSSTSSVQRVARSCSTRFFRCEVVVTRKYEHEHHTYTDKPIAIDINATDDGRVEMTISVPPLDDGDNKHKYTIHAKMPPNTAAQLIDELQAALAVARSWLEKN